MRERGYDRESAVQYARRWALSRNPAYYDFENIGGDCTNFVSQCLYAGAGVMNYTPVYGWYFNSLADRTASWSGVEYLYNFLVTNTSVGPYGRVVDEYDIEPGDVIQLGRADGDFYHTTIVLTTQPEILIAAHSYDALNRPLSTYNYDVARFLYIDGVRVW